MENESKTEIATEQQQQQQQYKRDSLEFLLCSHSTHVTIYNCSFYIIVHYYRATTRWYSEWMEKNDKRKIRTANRHQNGIVTHVTQNFELKTKFFGVSAKQLMVVVKVMNPFIYIYNIVGKYPNTKVNIDGKIVKTKVIPKPEAETIFKD